MAASNSAAAMFAAAANQILARLSSIDPDSVSKAELRALQDLRRLVTETRLDLRDYEYADSRAEVERHGAAARKRLAAVRIAILAASETGVFGSADVAQVSAQLDAVTHALQ